MGRQKSAMKATNTATIESCKQGRGAAVLMDAHINPGDSHGVLAESEHPSDQKHPPLGSAQQPKQRTATEAKVSGHIMKGRKG